MPGADLHVEFHDAADAFNKVVEGKKIEGLVLSGDDVTATADLKETFAKLKVVRADGDNERKRISLAELRGIKLYEAADAFIPLLFPPAREVRGTQSYLLTLRRQGTVHLVTARAMRAAERNI